MGYVTVETVEYPVLVAVGGQFDRSHSVIDHGYELVCPDMPNMVFCLALCVVALLFEFMDDVALVVEQLHVVGSGIAGHQIGVGGFGSESALVGEC